MYNEELYRNCGVKDVETRWSELDVEWLHRIVKSDSSVPPYLSEMVKFSEKSYNLRSEKQIVFKSKIAVGESMFLSRLQKLFRTQSKNFGSINVLSCVVV